MPLPDRQLRPTAGGLREVARQLLRIGALFCVIGFAQAQEDAVERLVSADALRWIGHEDPVVRGEAALVLAANGAPRHHAAVLAIARDEAEPARLRGLLALGLQASPGVVQVLDGHLEDQSHRTGPEGICAAFALGTLPPDHAPAAVSRILSSFLNGNWKRQGPVLLALLLGMSRHPQHLQLTALQQLYAERANRDASIRAMLLQLLLPVDASIDGERVLALLDRGSAEERLVLLRWLTENSTDYDDELIRPIERLARGARQPAHRAAALAVLTRLRHPPAIEIAARAIRSDAAIEVEQGMFSALAIGGASMRHALESHLLEATDSALIAAMLRAWAAPPSEELSAHCMQLAADRAQPLEVRLAAASTLARSDPDRVAPLLRDLFRTATSPGDLVMLSRAIVARSSPMPQLSRLLPEPPDAAVHPRHWQALLAAAHPGAVRRLLQVLGATAPKTAELQAALTSWRRSMVTSRLGRDGVDMPAPLAALVQSPTP